MPAGPSPRNQSGQFRGLRRPGSPPHSSEIQQRTCAQHDHPGDHDEADPEAASLVFHRAEHAGQQKSAESASRADDSGHDADTIREALRDQLEYRSIAHAEHRHGQRQHRQRQTDRRQRRDRRQAKSDAGEQHEQHAITTQLVRQHAAYGSQEAAEQDHDGGEVAGLDFGQVILIVKKDGEITGEAHETAESQAVDETEPAGVGDAQDPPVVGPTLDCALDRRIFREEFYLRQLQ